MSNIQPLIAVYLITYRRNELLRRALASVLSQTHTNIAVKVVNDDPEDEAVARIVTETDDQRVTVFKPIVKRGATRNFNLMFEEREAGFVSLLEDDNWWEPRFLEEMLKVLQSHPGDRLVVGNERIWQELDNGEWRDTGNTIWPFRDIRYHHYRVEDICRWPLLPNSAMLARIDPEHDLRIPDSIPVDVTEHFRERLFAPQLLMLGRVLVNFSKTLQTARATRGEVYSTYQSLLIGSVFIAASNAAARRALAVRLWAGRPSFKSKLAVHLILAGLAVPEARALLRSAPIVALMSIPLWLARRPTRMWLRLSIVCKVRREHEEALAFLTKAPLTQYLARGLPQE